MRSEWPYDFHHGSNGVYIINPIPGLFCPAVHWPVQNYPAGPGAYPHFSPDPFIITVSHHVFHPKYLQDIFQSHKTFYKITAAVHIKSIAARHQVPVQSF